MAARRNGTEPSSMSTPPSASSGTSSTTVEHIGVIWIPCTSCVPMPK